MADNFEVRDSQIAVKEGLDAKNLAKQLDLSTTQLSQAIDAINSNIPLPSDKYGQVEKLNNLSAEALKGKLTDLLPALENAPVAPIAKDTGAKIPERSTKLRNLVAAMLFK